jgi:hypothetical protein
MAFVKLDTGILNSTLWDDRAGRDVFITALLMADLVEITEPTPTLRIRALEDDGFIVPPGWYGMVHAAGVGIVRQSLVDPAEGMTALERLASPESGSRSQDFDGRRLVRVDGGFVVLNYMKYRDRDYSAAVRSARYRARKKEKEDKASRVTITGVTHEEEEQEVEADNPPVDLVANPLTALVVWCNLAITEKWGEQTQPIRRDLCSKLAETVRGMDGPVVKDSIFAQCRAKTGEAPTHPNYFCKGVVAAWEREGARRATARSGEVAPPARAGKPRNTTKSERTDAALAAFLGVDHGE